AGHVRGPHRVAVHRGVVERRQRQRRGDVLGEHGAEGLVEIELERGDRSHGGEDLLQVPVDGLERDAVTGASGIVHVPTVAYRTRSSTKRRSHGRNSGARSSRSAANVTTVRRYSALLPVS